MSEKSKVENEKYTYIMGNENRPYFPTRHAYGCVITGDEYGHQCLGCGREW